MSDDVRTRCEPFRPLDIGGGDRLLRDGVGDLAGDLLERVAECAFPGPRSLGGVLA